MHCMQCELGAIVSKYHRYPAAAMIVHVHDTNSVVSPGAWPAMQPCSAALLSVCRVNVIRYLAFCSSATFQGMSSKHVTL